MAAGGVGPGEREAVAVIAAEEEADAAVDRAAGQAGREGLANGEPLGEVDRRSERVAVDQVGRGDGRLAGVDLAGLHGRVEAVAAFEVGEHQAVGVEAKGSVGALGFGGIDDGDAATAENLDRAVGPDEQGGVLVDAEAQGNLALDQRTGQAGQTAALAEVLVDQTAAEEAEALGQHGAALVGGGDQAKVEGIEHGTAGREHRVAHDGRTRTGSGDHAPSLEDGADGLPGGRAGVVGAEQSAGDVRLVAAAEEQAVASADLRRDGRVEGAAGGVLLGDLDDRGRAGRQAIAGREQGDHPAGVIVGNAGRRKNPEAGTLRAASQLDQGPMDLGIGVLQPAPDDQQAARISQSRRHQGQGRQQRGEDKRPRAEQSKIERNARHAWMSPHGGVDGPRRLLHPVAGMTDRRRASRPRPARAGVKTSGWSALRSGGIVVEELLNDHGKMADPVGKGPFLIRAKELRQAVGVADAGVVSPGVEHDDPQDARREVLGHLGEQVRPALAGRTNLDGQRGDVVRDRRGATRVEDQATTREGSPAIGSEAERVAALDGLIVGPENTLAHASVLALARGDVVGAKLSPLVLHGPAGVGKSRLLAGLVEAWLGRRPGASVAHLGAEAFVARCAEAAGRVGGWAELRGQFRGLNLFVIEDLHALERAPLALEELGHTLDALAEVGASVAASAREGPGRWSQSGWPARLVSRLVGGLAVRIDPPGPASRRRFVLEGARARGLTLAAEAVEALADAAEGYRTLEGWLARLTLAARLEAGGGRGRSRVLDQGQVAAILADDVAASLEADRGGSGRGADRERRGEAVRVAGAGPPLQLAAAGSGGPPAPGDLPGPRANRFELRGDRGVLRRPGRQDRAPRLPGHRTPAGSRPLPGGGRRRAGQPDAARQ